MSEDNGILRPARDLLLTSRMPVFPKHHAGPFSIGQDVHARCQKCGMCAAGPDEDVRKWIDDHHAQWHPEERVAFSLNVPTM